MVEEKIVRLVYERCLGYKKRERLLIVTDDELEDIAEVFYRGARKLNMEVSMVKVAPGKIHGEEPPLVVCRALESVDIALLLTKKSLSHTKARRRACQRFGVRIASLPGITEEIFRRSLLIDYQDLTKKVSRLAQILTKGNILKVTTSKGTDLVMSIKGRRGFEDNGLYRLPGKFGNLPAGEACIAPLEGSANGILVVDASMAPLGRLLRPIKLVIKDGLIDRISSMRFQSILRPLGKDVLNLAELGIGLNPKAKVTGNVLEDEKAISTAHVAFGDNTSFGGNIEAPCHLDGVFFNPQIVIDGKRIEIS